MALTKIEYSTGDTLTAEQVNEMQDAIIENENELSKLTGFGLGELSTLTTDLNTNNINGWYYYGASATNRPQYIQYGCLLVINRSGSETEVVQIAFSTIDGTKAKRTYRNSTDGWSEWEYENPPMANGVEYRTTERWLGKPVYTKLLTIAWAKDNVHTISNFDGKTIHKYFGKVGTWTIPFMYQGKLDGDYSAIVAVHKNNNDLKIGMYGGSSINGNLELQIWYIKE